MSIDIREATEADVEAACRLLAVQLQEHGVQIEPSVLRSALSGLVRVAGRGKVLVARDASKEIIGIACLSYVWTLEHGGTCAWLDELYVVPHRRGAGIGVALLREAIARVREEGALALDLEVDEEHLRAERLYEREGFRRLPRRRWSRRLTA